MTMQLLCNRGTYQARTMKSPKAVAEMCYNKPLKELRILFDDYDHQLKHQDLSALSKVEAWMWLQGIISVLMDRNLWDYRLRKPSGPTTTTYGWAD